MFFNWFCLVLEVDKAALDLVPDWEVVHVVECDERIEGEYENLKVYKGWQKYFLKIQ